MALHGTKMTQQRQMILADRRAFLWTAVSGWRFSFSQSRIHDRRDRQDWRPFLL